MKRIGPDLNWESHAYMGRMVKMVSSPFCFGTAKMRENIPSPSEIFRMKGCIPGVGSLLC